MSKSSNKAVLFLAASAALGGYTVVRADTPITSFTPGDLVVVRGTAVSGQTASTSVSAFLDEYTTSGSYVGTINIPSTTSGNNDPLTLALGGGSHEGQLQLSPNGQFLTFAGYNTPTNGVIVGTSATTQPPITVGLIGPTAASLNTATQLTGVAGAEARGAITVDGKEFYVAEGGGSNSSQGVQYVTGIGAGATQQAINATWDTRYFAVLNNSSLIAGSGSSSMGTANSLAPAATGHGVWLLGTTSTPPNLASTATLPTSTVPTTSDYQITNNTTDGTAFAFANLPSTLGTYGTGGPNVLYVVGGPGSAQVIAKYAYNASQGVFDVVNTVVPPGGSSSALYGLTVEPDPSNPNNIDLFYTEAGKGVYELVDSTDSATGALTTPVANSNPLIPAGLNDGTNGGATLDFDYGVAFAPGTSSVPEPASLGLLTLAAGGLLGRRRRRHA